MGRKGPPAKAFQLKKSSRAAGELNRDRVFAAVKKRRRALRSEESASDRSSGSNGA
jgi:hypothetical protein